MSKSRSQSQSRSRIGRSIGATQVFLLKQIWIWPILAAIMLGIIGFVVRNAVETEFKNNLSAELQTILDADVAALRIWLSAQERSVETIASDPNVYQPIVELAKLGQREDVNARMLIDSPAQADLNAELKHWMTSNHYYGFGVVTARSLFLAGDRAEVIGRDDLATPEGLFDRVFAGQATVTRPFESQLMLKTSTGNVKAGVPTMYAVAPVYDEEGTIVAALGLRIRPNEDFTRILSIASAGKTGETYAFDKNGLLISQSRFDDQLKRIGLLTDSKESSSLLSIEIRDPGVDMTQGHRPQKLRAEQPLTRMASDAIAGNDNVDVEGYNDYRGAQVVGAWTWLDEYDFGVATEVDVAEAYSALNVLRYTFWGLFGLLAASAVAIFVFTLMVARLNKSAQDAVLKAERLGQYTLEEKIGEGGMGVVYRGHHAMLQRPTAIKLLSAEKSTAEVVERFAREVKLTAKLNHPNTIAIYDYGRTPEGVFYYAMEYLDGIDLDDLGEVFGPQPEARVIHVMRQMCGSLAEAHDVGLIHRDIKPANVVVNQRGGLYDVVKVLDFGLVKALDSQADTAITMAGTIIGTPLYMAPESIETPEDVDGRSDLYAVAAVGYFLLTGKTVFEGSTLTQVCLKQVSEAPVTPSERAGIEVSEDLQQVIMRCLEKDPGRRYQTAWEMDAALSECQSNGKWTREQAQLWWEQNGGRLQRRGPADETKQGAEPTDGIPAETIMLSDDGELS